MTIFENEKWKFKIAKIDAEVHKKLKALYPLAGYKKLQDFINEGLVNWIKFVKEELRSKKK